MNEEELFALVRQAYYSANVNYIKEQVKEALKEPLLSKDETVDGLIDWIVIAGSAGMNEKYRKFVYSAIAYLLKKEECETCTDDIFESFRCCITQQKCKKCPRAKNGCNANSTMGNGIQIPKLLALDVLNKLKELQNEVDELSFQLYG